MKWLCKTRYLLLLICFSLQAQAWVQGIYVTQTTVQNRALLAQLIRNAKACKIDTFVIDLKYPSRVYQQNIKLVEQSGIRYVARIVVFPHGGTDAQVLSRSYWQKKYQLVATAISYGAREIQLDYIRYRSSQRASRQNARNIYQVIKWFKSQLMVPLQIDVFGVASFGHSIHIGHDLRLFADSVDAICPMLYPSHYEPFQHSRMPYYTVLKSLKALRAQFAGNIPFKVYVFIEVSNYRMRMSSKQKQQYIYEQIRAVKDGDADGWYAWSPDNKYHNLFSVLRGYNDRRDF